MSTKSVEISPNVHMPLIGLGTYKITGHDNVHAALDAALKVGYRFIDTAQLYQNEEYIGNCLKELLQAHNLKREDIFIITKLHVDNMNNPSSIRNSFEESLKKLKVDYVDLFLIHFPKPSAFGYKDPLNQQARLDAWRELENFLIQKKTRAIGVSNYEIRHLKELHGFQHQPSVNQCEFHPLFARLDLVQYCQDNNIHFQAFTPLARNNPDLHNDPVIQGMMQKYKATSSQIVLAWSMKRNVSVLPKSANPERIEENFGATKVELSDDDLKAIDSLNKNQSCLSGCDSWNVL